MGLVPVPGATAQPAAACVTAFTPADAAAIPATVEACPEGTAFTFAPGTYAMTAAIVPRTGDSFVGAGDDVTGTATILDAAKDLVGWTASGSAWFHTGAPGEIVPLRLGTLGHCVGDPTSRCAYPDWLYEVTGDGAITTLQRVLAPCSGTNVVPGTFCVDYGASTIWVGDDPASRSWMWSDLGAPGSIGDGAFDRGPGRSSDVSITGFVMEGYSRADNAGCVVRTADGWTVDGVRVMYSGACGVSLTGTGTVVQNSRFDHIRQMGYGGTDAVDALFQDNEVDHDNTIGWDGQWGAGGGKISHSFHARFIGNSVHDNWGTGIWFDVDDQDGVVSGNHIWNNSGAFGGGHGVQYEVSCGGTISGNDVEGNDGIQISTNGSHDDLIGGPGPQDGNVVVASARGSQGIQVGNRDRGSNLRCGLADGRHSTVQNNSITLSGGSSVGGFAVTPPVLSIFEGNAYHVPSCTRSLWRYPGAGNLTFAQWQQLGQDGPGTGATCGP